MARNKAKLKASGKKNDAVQHPAHYTQGKVECIDAIESAITDIPDGTNAFLTGQVIKYMWRWFHKGGKEDVLKARWYIDRLLARL